MSGDGFRADVCVVDGGNELQVHLFKSERGKSVALTHTHTNTQIISV